MKQLSLFMENPTDQPKRKGRGFASMDDARRREIAAKGGRNAQAKGTAHRFTSETAREAGREGGKISRGGRGRNFPRTTPDTSAA